MSLRPFRGRCPSCGHDHGHDLKMLPASRDPLLTMRAIVLAPLNVLQGRLSERLAERSARQGRKHPYGQSVSDAWLEQEIDTLQAAIVAYRLADQPKDVEGGAA